MLKFNEVHEVLGTHGAVASQSLFRPSASSLLCSLRNLQFFSSHDAAREGRYVTHITRADSMDISEVPNHVLIAEKTCTSKNFSKTRTRFV